MYDLISANYCVIIREVAHKEGRVVGENSRGAGDKDQDCQGSLMYQLLMMREEGSSSAAVAEAVPSSSLMLSDACREREMSVMVSALTHVVAGDVPADDEELSGNEYLDWRSNNINHSLEFGGLKRGREEVDGCATGGGGGGRMAVESAANLCTQYVHLPHGGSSSALSGGKQHSRKFKLLLIFL